MILVLLNAHARYVRKYGAEKLRTRIQEILGNSGKVLLTESIDHLAECIAAESPETITAVVPFGGDGTVSVVLTHARAIWGMDRIPPVFTVFAGTMNEIATDIHAIKAKPLVALQKLAAGICAGSPLKNSPRYPMVVNQQKLGFAFGLGASSEFLSNYYAEGASVMQAVKLVILYTLSALVHGRLIRQLFRPLTGELMVNGSKQSIEWNIMLALTVKKLPLGVQLSMSGCPNAGPDLCYVAGKARLVRLALALPLIWFGKLPAGTGLTRLQTNALNLDFANPVDWHLDGDLHEATRQIDIRVEHPVRMISLD